MKAWIILTILAVALTAVATFSVSLLPDSPNGPSFPAPVKTAGPPPKLVINEDTIFNFGSSPQATIGSHKWVFKNDGAGVLEVRGSSTSCSCTTSDLFVIEADQKTGRLIKIPPGESKEITVEWNSKTFEGVYRQYIKIATNDPDHPLVQLDVQGTIKLALVTNPVDSTVSFMNVSNDEPAHRRVFLTSPDRPETKITKVTSTNPELLTAEVKPLTPEELKNTKYEKGFWIDITLKPSPNLGEFNEEIQLETDHPLRKSHAIKAKGRVTGSILVLPERVEMPDATTVDGGKQTLMILARSQHSVRFTVDKKPAGMDVEIDPIAGDPQAKGSKYRMVVRLVPGLQAGPLRGEIVLKSDDPKANELHVPVSILVKSPT